MKFEIKHRVSGALLFECEVGSLKLAVEAAIGSGADLSGANLSRAYLSGADLSRAYLSGADLSGADLSGAYLSGAYLSGADLSRADLLRAYLSGADLLRAYLSRADLSGANLSRADLSGANLSGTNLSGAYLSRADLSGTNLSGADLSRADLSRTNLSGAVGINPCRADALRDMVDQPGRQVKYKLVHANGDGCGSTWGVYPAGTTPLTYEVGLEYAVDNASTDETAPCGAGIHLATLPWCIQYWEKGDRILIAEFTAADIAAIPIGTDGKFRVHRCKIVDEKDLVELGLVEASKDENEWHE
jgi:uncharacterized protein YjbI with pentapeptide repeats